MLRNRIFPFFNLKDSLYISPNRMNLPSRPAKGDSMSKLLIKNGKIIRSDAIIQSDILIRDQSILNISPHIEDDDAQIYDARGHYIFPGFIDAHTHMGVPIRQTTSADNFDSGTLAALHGGVTTIIDFTVQRPGESLLASLERRQDEADGKASVDYALHCNVTDWEAIHADEFKQIIDKGVMSFKVFTAYREAGMQLSDRQIMEVLWQVKQVGGMVMVHAENGDMIDFLTDKYVRFNKTGAAYHALSRPAEAEIEAVARVNTLNKFIQCPLYFVHLSTRGAVEIAATLKQNNQKVYLETCPQYLFFDQSVYDKEDGHRFIAAPPFRSGQDVQFLWQALGKRWIDVVATDHCPFSLEQKDMGQKQFHRTPNGLPGVETLFTVLYNEGVRKERLTLQDLVRLIAEEPARRFGLFPRKGSLAENSDADLVIFDPQGEGKIQAKNLHSQIDWSPYEGVPTQGKISAVMLRGQWLLKDGQAVAKNWHQGRFIPAISSA